MFAFQIGSKADSEIFYRFDDKPPQPVEARILRGLKIFVIEDKTEVKQFLDALAKANALYIMISSLDKVRQARSFVWRARKRRSTSFPPTVLPRRSDIRTFPLTINAAFARSQFPC
jgi:hypothetical protein